MPTITYMILKPQKIKKRAYKPSGSVYSGVEIDARTGESKASASSGRV